MTNTPWIARGAALLGGIIYFLHALFYAHTQESVLDEGAYLLKGLWFVTGKYQPFQDYGPLTNHMPLSFIFHGFVQDWFGPGLRAGRYFAIALSVWMLAGLWLLIRRATADKNHPPPSVRSEWWAALAVWAVAINPATARIYSLATTQAMIACMLVWVLVLAIGEDRPLWQIAAGAALAGVMILTRLNLAPVLVLLIPYVFWQHGWRAGRWAALAGVFTLLTGHAIFWPGILKIWAYWIPTGLSPFLAPWRQPEAARFWAPAVSLDNRVLSFLQGMRFHFVAVTAFITTLFLWPRRDRRRAPSRFRASVFLAALFAVLFLEHALASLGLSYCVYCFPMYLSFFAPLGLILFAMANGLSRSPASFERASPVRQGAAALFVIGFAALLGYGAYGEIGERLVRLRVPRLKTLIVTGSLAAGIPLWDMLQTRFGIAFETSKRLIPALAGLLAGLLAAGIGWIVRKHPGWGGAFGGSSAAPIAFLLAGLLLSPTPILGNGFRTYDCGDDLNRSYQAAGQHLAGLIPPGSQVYWKGGNSAVPLLYVPGIEVYAPQLNGDYTIYEHDDSDTLLKFGLWSDALARQWLQEADFVLIEARFYSGWLRDTVESGNLESLPPTPPTVTCRPSAQILVFQRSER